MSRCANRHCVNITYWHFKPSLPILVLSVVSSAVPRLEGTMRIWRKPHSHPSQKGLETVWMVSFTWITCLAYSKITAILAAAKGTVYAYIIDSITTYWYFLVQICTDNYCSNKIHFTPCYDAQNDQMTSAVFQWPLECVLFQTMLDVCILYTHYYKCTLIIPLYWNQRYRHCRVHILVAPLQTSQPDVGLQQ